MKKSLIVVSIKFCFYFLCSIDFGFFNDFKVNMWIKKIFMVFIRYFKMKNSWKLIINRKFIFHNFPTTK